MKKSTKLRLFGGSVIMFNLWLCGQYNIQGVVGLLLTFGFAIAYELVVVRKVAKSEEVSGSLTRRLQERDSRPFKPANSSHNSSKANNEAYAAAFAEIEERRLDKGVWARAFSESGGDESKAKAAYIKARAEAIQSADVWIDTIPPDVADVADVKVTYKPTPVATPQPDKLLLAMLVFWFLFIIVVIMA